jgi:hypothetical protein|tara:strand:+ start:909 stop:1370 length:462 start_codon:yes stop_codon:yes gene_type:complete
MKQKYTLAYIVLIVVVNYGFSVVPLIPFMGEMFPIMSLVVGLIFVSRDFAQREIGHRVILAMIVAAGISYVMADPFVAIASLAAFTFSELADWTIYTFTKKEFKQRVLISSAVATPVDSVIFLTMIGHFSITGAVLMTASKMIGALVVWRMVR